MAKNNLLGAVILGAGASARMGGPKLLLPWRGTTVIGQIIAQWRELGAGQLVVVLRANDFALASELDRLNLSSSNRVENQNPERGMFGSIVCAALWPGWRQEISRWAMVLGDQPHLKTEMLRQLLDFSARHPEAVCQPVFGGRVGHPAILPRPAFLGLKDPGTSSLKEFLNLGLVPRKFCPVNDAGLLLDMDTPEDYKNLSSRDPVA